MDDLVRSICIDTFGRKVVFRERSCAIPSTIGGMDGVVAGTGQLVFFIMRILEEAIGIDVL
jgi:hypothetical protein